MVVAARPFAAFARTHGPPRDGLGGLRGLGDAGPAPCPRARTGRSAVNNDMRPCSAHIRRGGANPNLRLSRLSVASHERDHRGHLGGRFDGPLIAVGLRLILGLDVPSFQQFASPGWPGCKK